MCFVEKKKNQTAEIRTQNSHSQSERPEPLGHQSVVLVLFGVILCYSV